MRWAYFAPWAPGAGMAALTLAAVGRHDPDARWRWIGLAGVLCMAILVQSRLALISIPAASGAAFVLGRLTRPWVAGLGAAGALAAGFGFSPLLEKAAALKASFEA